MITKNSLILFYVENVHKKSDKKKKKEEGHSSGEEEWDFEEVEKLSLV